MVFGSGFWNAYPGTDLHEIDLHYVLMQLLQLRKDMQAVIDAQAITFADPINWNITSQYPANQVVLDSNGDGYISRQPVPEGIPLSNTNYWTQIFSFNDIADRIRASVAVNAGTSATAPEALTTGELVWWQGDIYRVLVNMPAGTAFIEGTNIERFTVDDKIELYADAIRDLQAADIELQQNIEDEAQERAEAIAEEAQAREDAIAAEAAAREAQDNILEQKIDAIDLEGVESFINLTVNRYGTGIIKDTDDAYSGVQGFCMLDDTTAAVYFADYNNQSNSGRLRKMNVKSGIWSDDLLLEGAGHGQTVCYDGTYIYILYFTGGASDVNNQKITIVRASTWSKIGTYTIQFNGPALFVSAVSYDKTDSKIKCIVEPSPGSSVEIAEASYAGSTFTINTTIRQALEYVFSGEFLDTDAHNNGTSYCYTEKYVMTLTNEPQSILVWDKTDGHYVKSMNIGPLFADDFWMGESEGMDVQPDGNAVLGFMAIANRSIWTQGSGWYMHSFGYTNVFHNVVPWTPYNGVQWDAGFRASFHTDPNYDRYDGDGSTGKPMQSVYIPMLYKPKFGGFNIQVDAAETIKNLSIVNREDIAIYCHNRLTVQQATSVKYSRNITISELIGRQDLLMEQSDARVIDGAYNDISLTESLITIGLNNTSIINGNMIFDTKSDIILINGGLNYDKLTNRIPPHIEWFKNAPNVTITANGISTGVDRSKFGTQNDEIWVAINTGNKYIRVPMICNTGEMYVPWVYGSSRGVVDLAFTNNILYVKGLTDDTDGDILSQVTSITVYSTK